VALGWAVRSIAIDVALPHRAEHAVNAGNFAVANTVGVRHTDHMQQQP